MWWGTHARIKLNPLPSTKPLPRPAAVAPRRAHPTPRSGGTTHHTAWLPLCHGPTVGPDWIRIMALSTTGQRATVTRSIIAGEPRSTSTVDVISIDGDTLTYTVDGVWFSTVNRDALSDWQLVGDTYTTTVSYDDALVTVGGYDGHTNAEFFTLPPGAIAHLIAQLSGALASMAARA